METLRREIDLLNRITWLRYHLEDSMPYCPYISADCAAGGNALRCSKTECPAAPKEDDDEQSVQAV